MFRKFKYIAVTLVVVALFAMTQGDLARIRTLATSSTFFVTQLAELTRLEKEMLKFRVLAADFERGEPSVTRDEVMMSFDILWSRVHTEGTRFINPEIDAIRNYQGTFDGFAARLHDIDPQVQALKPGDEQSLAVIEQAMVEFAGAIAQMNTDAYAEIYSRSLSTTEMQRDALTSAKHIQWIYLVVGFGACIILMLQLRRGEKLYSILQQREAEIRTLATIDPLTGLGNRRYFDDRMRAIDEGNWQGDCNILLIDIDGFKRVNDDFGHEAGDELLRELAKRLRGVAGHSSVLARLGGDEFVIIAAVSLDRACEIAAAAVSVSRLPFYYQNGMLQVGASIGVSTHREGQKNAALMLRQADLALYEAKARGRNCFVVHNQNAAAELTERPAA